jgi:hypothetical protein
VTNQVKQSPQAPDSRPTVGDTINVVHRVPAPSDALVQPRVPVDSLLATLVSHPTVVREGDSVRIAYTVAVWSPGRNELTIPGPLVLHSDGSVDTLPDARVLLDVASVLPTGEPIESLAPRQALPWVERSETSILPFGVLMLPIVLVLIVAGYLWRRRRKPVIGGPVLDEIDMPLTERVSAWIEAGEVTLAIDHLLVALPKSEELEDWRSRVAEVRFQADHDGQLRSLAREGLQLLPVEHGSEQQ